MNLYESIKAGLEDKTSYSLDSLADEIKQAYIDGCKEADLKWGGGIQRDYHPPYWDFDETLDNLLVIDISWGDWKHDHRLCDNLVRDVASRHGLDVKIDTDVYEEDGSDCYSARHICKFSGTYKETAAPEPFNLLTPIMDKEEPKDEFVSPAKDYPDYVKEKLANKEDASTWYCDSCHQYFEEPVSKRTDMENYYGVGSDFPDHHYQNILHCPFCDSDDIEEQNIYFDSLVDEFLDDPKGYELVYEEISKRRPELIKTSDTTLEDLIDEPEILDIVAENI